MGDVVEENFWAQSTITFSFVKEHHHRKWKSKDVAGIFPKKTTSKKAS